MTKTALRINFFNSNLRESFSINRNEIVMKIPNQRIHLWWP